MIELRDDIAEEWRMQRLEASTRIAHHAIQRGMPTPSVWDLQRVSEIGVELSDKIIALRQQAAIGDNSQRGLLNRKVSLGLAALGDIAKETYAIAAMMRMQQLEQELRWVEELGDV